MRDEVRLALLAATPDLLELSANFSRKLTGEDMVDFVIDYLGWRKGFVKSNPHSRVVWNDDHTQWFYEDLSVSVLDLLSWTTVWLCLRGFIVETISEAESQSLAKKIVLAANNLLIEVRKNNSFKPKLQIPIVGILEQAAEQDRKFLDAIAFENAQLHRME